MLPVPVEDISDKFFQKCRIRAVHRGKLHTASFGARIRARPRAVERKDPDRRQLAFRLVLADRLAEFPALADRIEDIVRELEEIAERKPEEKQETEEKKPREVYYLVEKKKKPKSDYSRPKKISFDD